jgi:hypothetical protein
MGFLWSMNLILNIRVRIKFLLKKFKACNSLSIFKIYKLLIIRWSDTVLSRPRPLLKQPTVRHSDSRIIHTGPQSLIICHKAHRPRKAAHCDAVQSCHNYQVFGRRYCLRLQCTDFKHLPEHTVSYSKQRSMNRRHFTETSNHFCFIKKLYLWGSTRMTVTSQVPLAMCIVKGSLYKRRIYYIWYDMIWYDIFVNCNWVDTRWQ